MANSSRIFGLKPIRNATQGNYAGATIKCLIPAADANNMAVGDPVVLAGDANPGQVAAYADQVDGAYPTIALAAAGVAIWGVIDSFEPRAVVGYEQPLYRPASTAVYAHVMVDPNIEYEIQAATGTVITTADIGRTCDLVAGAVDPVYGRSGYQADLSTLGNDAADQLLILGMQDRTADNELLDLAKLRVKINNSAWAATGVAGA